MATRKRSGKSTGRPRGRPRKVAADTPVVRDLDGVSDKLAAPAGNVDTMIRAATEAPPVDRAAALEALADKIEHDAREDTPVYSGPVRTPGASDKAVAQLSQQIAGLAVVLFGLMALWRGDEWALSEDEAGLLGDATAEPYADDAAELARQIKWVGPVTAFVGIVGQKVLAEVKRRHGEKDAGERMPGTAPNNGSHG